MALGRWPELRTRFSDGVAVGKPSWIRRRVKLRPCPSRKRWVTASQGGVRVNLIVEADDAVSEVRTGQQLMAGGAGMLTTAI